MSFYLVWVGFKTGVELFKADLMFILHSWVEKEMLDSIEKTPTHLRLTLCPANVKDDCLFGLLQ